tara:strand:+ start:38 stop:889 length:852 start_codon:yes stop_codon:yes gene_type:complete
MNFTYEIPNINDPHVCADWIEFYVILTGLDMAKTEFQDFIENTQGLDSDEVDLGILDSVWQELEYREFLYGSNSPFRVNRSLVSSNIQSWTEVPYQVMCLIFSLEGNDHTPDYTPSQSGSLFEKIIEAATASFFQGKAFIFGYPNETLKSFSERLEHIEFSRPLHPDLNDGGLDVLSTGPFNDSRPNELSILIQCAAGRNWITKIDDLNIDEWNTRLDFTVVPTKGFAVPIVMKPRDIFKRSKRMGLLLDRPRIYKTLKLVDCSSIQIEIEGWCDSRLKQLIA